MGFFTAFGFAADVVGFAGIIKNKFRRSDADWKEFLSFVKKLIKAVCKDYSDFIEASPDHRDIHFPSEYELLLYDSVHKALEDNTPFLSEMVLPLENEFPQSEKRRLYDLLKVRLQFSFEFAMRDSQAEIQAQLQSLTSSLAEIVPYLNEILAYDKDTNEKVNIINTNVDKLIKLHEKRAKSSNDNIIDISFAYEQAFQNAIHVSNAYHIVPKELFQRNDELKLLSNVCESDTGYVLLEATAYTGKSALLSWFFTHPPKDIWMVGYFLARRIGRADCERFETSVKSQLIAIISPLFTDEYRIGLREKSIAQLLEEAAGISKENGKKLVFIIDGIDESIDANYNIPSVLNLLPKKNIPNLVVILSCRPNPDVFENATLSSDHAARKYKKYEISQSQYVQDLQLAAQAELRALSIDETSKEVIALLAVAQSGLTISDLCELANVKYKADIKKIFNASTGRTFICITSDLKPFDTQFEKNYAFAHQILLEQALEDFVEPNIQRYIEKFNKWCGAYCKKGFPDNTPTYLMDGYLRLMAKAEQWEHIADLIIGPAYIRAISKNTLSCAYYLHLINDTIVGLSQKEKVDYVRIGLLTESREWLSHRDENIPQELPVLFTKLGYIDEAYAMTKTMSDKDRLSCLSKIAIAMAQPQNANKKRAVEIALEVISEIPLDEKFMFQRSNMHEHDYTLYLTNCTTALVLCGESGKAEEFFSRLITTLLLDERLARGKGEIFISHLREVVIATAEAGDIESAIRKADMLAFDWQTIGFSLVHIGVLQALQKDFAGAIETCKKAHLANRHIYDGEIHQNEHITLGIVKILTLIEIISQLGDSSFSSDMCHVDFTCPEDGKPKQLGTTGFIKIINDNNARVNYRDYFDRCFGEMYIEVAEGLLSLSLFEEALSIVEEARSILNEYYDSYENANENIKSSRAIEAASDFQKIAVIEASCSNIENALKTTESIPDTEGVHSALLAIARTTLLKGDTHTADSLLSKVSIDSPKSKVYATAVQTIALIRGHEAAIKMLTDNANVKRRIESLCQIAEERLLVDDKKGAEYIAHYAFGILSGHEYSLAGLPDYGVRVKKFDNKKISKKLFDIEEYELALKIASFSDNIKWFAKLLLKIANQIDITEKEKAVRLFKTALSIVNSSDIEIDVNRREGSSYGNYDYEKDHPTITDLALTARSLLYLGETNAIKTHLPPYSELSKLLWQSTDLYAYELLHVYAHLGERGAIENDIVSIAEEWQLDYAKAWLCEIADSFPAIDFSDTLFSFKRSSEDGSLTVCYKAKNIENLGLNLVGSFGGNQKHAIPIDHYTELEMLSELYEKGSHEKISAKITMLSAPYSNTGYNYGEKTKWCVRMTALIHQLIKIGAFEKYKYLLDKLETFINEDDTLRDEMLYTIVDILLKVGRPMADIMEKVRTTYDKNYDGERYNPNRPRVIRTLILILSMHQNEPEALGILREASFDYITSGYFGELSDCINSEKNLGIDLGLQNALNSALLSETWYSMLELLAHIDIDALRTIIETSIVRMSENVTDSCVLKLIDLIQDMYED